MLYWNLALLFGVGSIAGFINVNAGGGSSLTLPTLIFMGLDGVTANGTNRIALLVQNIFAVASFHKNKMSQFKTSFHLALFTLPGAVIGAIIATRISSALFERILGIVLIFIVLSMLFPHSYKNKNTGSRNWLIYPSLLVIGFYGGFIQAGVGFLFMAALYHLLRVDLIKVNMHKVFIILIYTIPALFVFMYTDHLNWKYGLALAAGNALGGWLGVHAAVKGGEKIIRIILCIAIIIMAIKLFGVF